METNLRKKFVDRFIILTLIGFLVFVFLFWFLLKDQLKYQNSNQLNQTLNSTNTIGQIENDVQVRQTFVSSSDVISGFSLKFHTYNKPNTGNISVHLSNLTTGERIYQREIDTSKLVNDAMVYFELNKPIEDVKNQTFEILINGKSEQKQYVTLWIDETLVDNDDHLSVANQDVYGRLTMKIYQKDVFPFNSVFLTFFGITLIFLLFVLMKYHSAVNKGKRYWLDVLIQTFLKYRFLLQQLIGRDFKTKYRRSALGVVWSFLNPLLTMAVQYFVFSNIFRSSIENFPVYLLSAIIVFNFFSEASNLSLTSVTSNASLITKVYIPKYVFPISRVMSSSINFALSFIPLAIVVLLTGQKLTFNIFLLSYSIVFTIILYIGIGFILSTLLVFFRDMQFLWSVILMIWMYATPIFYPASIIPDKYRLILTLNPIYHIIDFNRTILLNGNSPELISYLLIAVFSLTVLAIGAFVFKKSQDKFIFYL